MTRIELADAMLRGLHAQGVVESKDHYISVELGDHVEFCRVSALGAALVGDYDGDYQQAYEAFRERDNELNRGSEYNEHYYSEHDVSADLLDISPALAIDIEHKHLNGWPIEQIAAWLKSEEVEVSINV